MSTSQNGWPVYTSSAGLEPLSWITGRVRPGAVHKIFDYLARRFNAEVERVTVGHSWGYAYRAIRGATTISNHASATAIDLNAPKHPLGAVNTFSSAERAAIRRILRDLDGVVRWGGDYAGRKDEMHFEINASSAAVAKVAARLNTSKPTTPAKSPKEPDMNNTQAKQLSEVREITGDLKELLAELHSGVAPLIDKTAATGAEKVTFRTATKEIRLAVTGQLNRTVTKAVEKALENTTGVDKAAITTAVTAAVSEAMADAVDDTEYVLTPKES